MIRRKSIDLLIDLYVILIAARNVCLFCGISKLATLLFYAVHFVVAFLIAVEAVVCAAATVRISFFLGLSLAVLVALIVIPAQYGTAIWVENGFMPISFLLTMLLIIVSRGIVVSDNTIRICCFAAIIQAVFAILLAFFPGSYEYGSLILHMINPNQTAIVLWTILPFCFLYWAKKKQRKERAIGLWLLMGGVLILIYLTDSRTALLSFLIVIALYFWVEKIIVRKNIPAILRFILTISPIIIPVFVLVLYRVLPKDITFLGKMIFSGREEIWDNIATVFFQHPFASHLDKSPFSTPILVNGVVMQKAMGAHNGFLAIQWYYGFAVALIVLCIIIIRLADMKRCAASNSNSRIVYMFVVATIFALSFEEGMLLGNVCTTMILPVLFIIGQSEALSSNVCKTMIFPVLFIIGPREALREAESDYEAV